MFHVNKYWNDQNQKRAQNWDTSVHVETTCFLMKGKSIHLGLGNSLGLASIFRCGHAKMC